MKLREFLSLATDLGKLLVIFSEEHPTIGVTQDELLVIGTCGGVHRGHRPAGEGYPELRQDPLH